MIYLDNQATTTCDPRVLAAMLPFFSEKFGNPHSIEHGHGRMAETAVETARGEVAALIGAEGREIIFTSGATESNNIAIKGAARYARRHGVDRRRVISVVTEHPCVRESVADLAEDGFEPIFLPVQSDGRLDPERLRAALTVPTLVVSVMTANNEIGVIQDIATLSEISRVAGALFHTDAAQGVGKIDVNVKGQGIDLLSLSGHKIYGPKGVGALYVRRRPRARLDPLFSGGGQERGLRSGTLPTPLIVGLGTACRIAAAEMESEGRRVLALREGMMTRLRAAIPGLILNGSVEHRLPGNLNLTFPDQLAQTIMAACPELCVSTGSACSSADIEPSYVLRALGLNAEAASRSLRIGIGRFTSPTDIEGAVSALVTATRFGGVGQSAA